jgi:hypothetical protein
MIYMPEQTGFNMFLNSISRRAKAIQEVCGLGDVISKANSAWVM